MFSSPNAGKSVDSLSPLSPGGRADYAFHSRNKPASRRGSTASSIHSIGGALHSSVSGGNVSVYESGQNAISTLLQPPIVRTGLQPHTTAPTSSAHKPPTARDIPPVTLTNIPHVDAEDFKPYLSQVGALYEQLRRIQENDDDAAASGRPFKLDEPSESADGYLRPSRTRPVRRGSTSSITSLASIDAPSPSRKPSISFSRKAAQGPPPLSTIPTVYFDEGFHLENPRTFDIVSERSEVIKPAEGKPKGDSAAPRKALATNAILQEKLSWYMDTIEMHLINSISTASTTFFTALGSLKELHSEAAGSVDRIKTLRQELEALDREIAMSGLEAVQKRSRQQNLQALSDAVEQLRQVAEGLATCETLVDEGEVDKALKSIDILEKLISGERDGPVDDGPKLRDLRGAAALQSIDADLNTLRFRAGKAYESQFSAILFADLRRHVESVSNADVLLRWDNAASRTRGGHSRSPSIFPTYLTATEDLKAQLHPVMAGLSRARHVSTAALAYKEAALKEIRNLIRRPLPSSSEDDNMSLMSVSTAGGGRHLSSQEKSANLARNLRALEPEDAEDLLKKMYVGVTETLRRLYTQVKVLLDIASSLADTTGGDGIKSPTVRSPLGSPRPVKAPFPGLEIQEEMHRALDVTNLLAQGVDIANDKIVKVLKVRTEQATGLSLDMFLRYFTLNLYFANECEAISGRSGTPLKNVVNSHIKEFVQRHQNAAMQTLAQGMEADRWVAKDFNEKLTRQLGEILECSTHDAEAWGNGNKLWVPAIELLRLKLEEESAEKEKEKSSGERERARPAVIESEKFILPNSAILCIQGLEHFLHLIAGIPSMTTDIAASLIAYLQLFNSRCTQLILGAGATKTAGLRNITTKHLSLASQALSLMATLMPHIREFVRRHAGTSAGTSVLMGEFDKIRRLLQEHQSNIHQKLVEIMNGRAILHSKGMKTIQWHKDDEGASAHAYMETLVRETVTLHKVLTKHLPENVIQAIMVPVFSGYKEVLGSAFRDAEAKNKAGQQSMLRDVELFKSTLGGLDEFGDVGEYLTNIVKSKEVAPEKAPEEPRQDTKLEDKAKQDKADDGKDEDKKMEKNIVTKDEKTVSSEEDGPEPRAKNDVDVNGNGNKGKADM
ncbi:Vps54-like protein [Cordyceps militaris]|uniref:Vps54-like protein n=1 Tax=Cordyceps militaris TaxID=73501 RepID=A0A2H4SC50_CORMI|nr:Vps54-like protein [Cordyceps militaris]